MIEETLFWQYYGEKVGNSVEIISPWASLLLLVLAVCVVFYSFKNI